MLLLLQVVSVPSLLGGGEACLPPLATRYVLYVAAAAAAAAAAGTFCAILAVRYLAEVKPAMAGHESWSTGQKGAALVSLIAACILVPGRWQQQQAMQVCVPGGGGV
jgi:hypothetical protein